MATKVLIHPDGTSVCQTEPVPEGGGDPFPVAPGLSWKDAPDGTTTKHTYNKTSGVFTPPPPLPPRPTTWRGKALEQITSAEAMDWIKARMAESGEKE
jgi:hypothetical protein